MTNPGFMGQQAAAAASRAAQQNASTSYNTLVQGASRAARSHPNSYRRAPRRVGFFGLIGRLVGFVFSLAVIAVAIAILLLILSVAVPGWFDHVKSWFDQVH